MKKILLLVLIVIFTVMSVGCNKTKDYLELDEFEVYENGATIELEEGSHFFSTMQNNLYIGKTLETKRGIKIGSSATEVATKYSDIRCIITSKESFRIFYSKQYNPKQFGLSNDYIVSFTTNTVDDRIFSFGRGKISPLEFGKVHIYSVDIHISSELVKDIVMSKY